MTCAKVCQRWINHANLINNCYPTNPGETRPNQNELAYLVFYASARPAKLTKCGVYLEKRVAADVRKRKKQDTEVSLAIIRALLDKCHQDINLFSKNILQVIESCLSTNDIDLISRATSLFIMFCEYHDGSTLGIDIEFTKVYEDLVSKFAEFSLHEAPSNPELERRYRSIGLHAIQGVATSEADFERVLKFILPAILHNLTDPEIGLEYLIKNNLHLPDTARPRRFSISVETISKTDNVQLAYHCLQQLFRFSTQSNIHWLMQPTFSFLEDNKMWWPNSFPSSLVFVILSSLQDQNKFTLVNDIIQQIDSLPNVSSSTPKKATFVEMLSTVLTSDSNLVGLSIANVLDDLLDFTIKSLKKNGSGTEINQEKDENLWSLILDGLIDSIGGLATHIYYGAQIKDIIERIIQRLNLRNSGDSSQSSSECSVFDGISPVDLRMTLLKCLNKVIQTNKEAELRFPDVPRNEVPMETFQDTVELCLDPDIGVRIAYSEVLVKFLENNKSKESKELQGFPIINQPTIHFLDLLHLSLYRYALSPGAQPSDYVALSAIFHALLIRFRGNQIIRGVPVLFKLQSEVREKFLKGVARQCAMASIIALYFRNVATVLDISELQEYVKKVQSECEKFPQSSTLIKTLSSSPINAFSNLDIASSFENEQTDSPENSLQPVDIWLDRSVVVPILCKHQDVASIYGADLESKLMTEWRPEEGFDHMKNDDNAPRIRTSRHLDLNQDLSTPPIITFENSSGEFAKPNIKKVEQLRDALVPQTVNDSSEHDTSVSDLESVNMAPLGKGVNRKRSKRMTSSKAKSEEVSAYLSSIDVKSVSTSSLVNPPYPSI